MRFPSCSPCSFSVASSCLPCIPFFIGFPSRFQFPSRGVALQIKASASKCGAKILTLTGNGIGRTLYVQLSYPFFPGFPKLPSNKFIKLLINKKLKCKFKFKISIIQKIPKLIRHYYSHYAYFVALLNNLIFSSKLLFYFKKIIYYSHSVNVLLAKRGKKLLVNK